MANHRKVIYGNQILFSADYKEAVANWIDGFALLCNVRSDAERRKL